MNNDLISREALKKAIMECMTTWDEHSNYGQGRLRSYEWTINLIDNAPTVSPQNVVIIPHELIEKLALCIVDTVENIDWDKALEAYKERPTGKWIIADVVLDYYHECPFCHWRNTVTSSLENFCPNCGAKMDGGEE